MSDLEDEHDYHTHEGIYGSSNMGSEYTDGSNFIFNDKLYDLALTLQAYCKHNGLPIFNRRDTSLIILNRLG